MMMMKTKWKNYNNKNKIFYGKEINFSPIPILNNTTTNSNNNHYN